MDTPSYSAVQRFRIRVGLGKKKPQRQVSLRRNTSMAAHQGLDGAPRTAAGRERGTSQHGRIASRKGVDGSHVDKQLTASDIEVVSVSSASHPRPSAVDIEHSGQQHEQNGRQSRASQKPGLSSHQSSSDQPVLKTKKSTGLLDMISTRLRVQTPTEDHAATPAAEHPARKSAANRMSASVARRNPRSGPLLENEFTSKARREEALRARGLLPPKPIKDLSEMEAELDARRMPVAPPDAGASQAKEIVEMWRKSNMFTLEEERTSTEASDAQDSPTALGQDIQVTGRPPNASPFSANSEYFTPMNTPMNVSQTTQSGSSTPRSPRMSSKTSLRNRPLGPRPTSPTNSRKSHSQHPSGSSFDCQFIYPSTPAISAQEPASTVIDDTNVTPLQPEDGASVSQSPRASEATPTPPSPRRCGTVDSAMSTRSETPGRKSSSGQRSQPQSPKMPGSPTSLRPPLSAHGPRSRSSTHSSHTHPAASPAPSGPLPPTPASPTARHMVLEPAPKIRPPARERTASGTSEPSSSENTTMTTPVSPTLPSLIESTSSHMSTATSSLSVLTPPVHGGFDRIGPNSKILSLKGSRVPVNPIIVESTEEDLLRHEIVMEPDAYLDREFGVRKDIPPSTLPAAVPRPARPIPINDDRRKSLGFFGKKRSHITDGAPELAKPLSLTNLRRTVTGALRSRPVSQAYAPSSRATPVPQLPVSQLASGWTKDSARLGVPDAAGMRRSVSPRMHSPGTILLQTKGIEDDESRRLSELAFLD